MQLPQLILLCNLLMKLARTKHPYFALWWYGGSSPYSKLWLSDLLVAGLQRDFPRDWGNWLKQPLPLTSQFLSVHLLVLAVDWLSVEYLFHPIIWQYRWLLWLLLLHSQDHWKKIALLHLLLPKLPNLVLPIEQLCQELMPHDVHKLQFL